MELLNKIQRELKAPKNQFNKFGGYKYRNCEDILEAVKPLLGEGTLILSDEIVQVGERYYVKATATLQYGEGLNGGIIRQATAYAREALDKKGMDEAQITGAASSYARKYALNGLFCIDDTKDADSQEPEAKAEPVARPVAPSSIAKKRELAKERIEALCDQLSEAPLVSDLEYADFVKRKTGLDYKPENYMEIGPKLKALTENK